MNGYLGKLLVVDLTSGQIEDEPQNENYVNQFIGGSGLAARLTGPWPRSVESCQSAVLHHRPAHGHPCPYVRTTRDLRPIPSDGHLERVSCGRVRGG